jgi:hypothetical protein
MKHRCNYLFKEVFNLRYKNYKKRKKNRMDKKHQVQIDLSYEACTLSP